MIEVYINGSLVDLPDDDVDFGIDYAMFNVSDIGNRSGTRSYTLELPITDRNRIALESSEIVNNLGELPYRKIPAKVFVDGVDIRISFCALRTVKDGYNVELYGGNSDLFYDLGNLEMRDLDLREWNHFWDFDNVANSRTNTEGYIYPLVHCIYPLGSAVDIASGDIRTDLLIPFYFVDTVLAKIFSELGVSFVNEIASEQWYIDNPIILESCNTTKDTKIGRYTAQFGLSANVFTPTGSYLSSGEVVSSDFNYFTNLTVNGNYGTGYAFAENSVSLRVSGKLFFENPTAPQNITMQIRRNGAANVAGQTLTITVPVSSGGGLPDAEVDFEFDVFTTENTDADNFFQILIYGPNLTSESYPDFGSYMDIECVSVNEYSGYLSYNTQIVTPFTHSYITAAQMMPDMSQGEFVKQYCQMFGLIVVYNELINEVRFIRLDKILSNIGNALDWSNKIDLSENPELSFINESYGKRNLFEYAEETDETKPTGTDGVIVIDNENLENEKSIVELSYSATNTFNQVVGSDTTRFNYMKVHERTADGGIVYIRYNNIPNPRILFLQKKTSTDLGYAPNYTDDIDSESVTTDIPLTWFIQTGDEFSEAKEYNLGFGINLLSKNYQLISSVIERNKTLSLLIRLTPSDINQLDFTIPVFLSKYESYFYINKIQGYAPGANESCIVELVKLNL